MFELGHHLTPSQIASFEQKGFLHFSAFLSPERIHSILSAIEAVEKNWLEGEIKQVKGVPLRMGIDSHGNPFIQRFAFASLFHPILHELIRDPRLKALLSLMGPGARIAEHEKDGMVINHYINREGSDFCRLGWHTDGIRDLFLSGKVAPMLNIGIHLDDCSMASGGLRVLPGTHKQGVWGLLFRKRSKTLLLQ